MMITMMTSAAQAAEAERLRVKRLIEAEAETARAEANDLAHRQRTGLPPRVKPPAEVVARRQARSNGMPEQETEDTIGRLWAWGFLSTPLPNGEACDIDSDLLRDAGRRYAASYWRRFGPVSPRASHFEEMSGRSSGPSRTVITDEERDQIAEERFRRRDEALRSVGAKKLVDMVCVDGAGDNDPGWLIETMRGFPAETRQERVGLASAEAMLGKGDDKAQRRAARNHKAAKRALDAKIREAKLTYWDPKVLGPIVAGLRELAMIDRGEGLHAPKRGRKPKSDAND